MFKSITISIPMIDRVTKKVETQRLPKFTTRELSSLSRHSRELLAEDVFQGIFSYEQKRAERSGKTFLLMLLNLERLLWANPSERTLPEIVSALYCSTRETDVTGWYRENTTLGVIFTEIRQTPKSPVESLIRAKVTDALRARVDVKQADRILFSFHVYPELYDHANLPTCTSTRGGAGRPARAL